MFYIRKTWPVLIILLGAQFIGLGLFAKGFFPYKSILPGFAKVDEFPQYPNGEEASPPEPLFDRLVFMLVDALRSDFIFGENSGMEFVKSLIGNRYAIPYTAIASAPTVTLPRIKALTTGTVPNFLDAVLNIAESDTSSSLARQDNWLIQLKNSRNKTISFFGDDTWIKLFPGVFNITDGTTSFFASDTVEVDLNVTRNVIPQLSSPEWDVLIFHYLGLDHVGHSSGPHSPLMFPKQQEMDDVAKTIFETIVKQDDIRIKQDENAKPTLFVLCGDHGMNEVGNHGGSSVGEVTTAFVFMSSKFQQVKHVREKMNSVHDIQSLRYYEVVDQIDLVPTLSLLFGIPIPKNNLGKVMLDVLEDSDPLEKLRMLQLNAHQLSGVLQTLWKTFDRDPDVINAQGIKDCDFDNGEEKERLQCLYWIAYYYHMKALGFFDMDFIKNATSFYEKFISESSSRLSSSSRDYDVESMFWGLLFMGFSAICFLMVITSQKSKQMLKSQGRKRLEFITLSSILGFCATLFASSYVEEEHQFWYFWIQTLWVGLFINSFDLHNYITDLRLALTLIGQMLLVRLIRSWNQTGQKYAGETDLRFYLNTSYFYTMWMLFFGTVLLLTTKTLLEIRFYMEAKYLKRRKLYKNSQLIVQLLVVIVAIMITKYKLEIGGGKELFPKIFEIIEIIAPVSTPVTLARVIYAILAFLALWIIISSPFKRINQTAQVSQITISTLLLCIATYLFILLSRPHNAPLYILYYIQYSLLIRWIRLNMKYGIQISPLTFNYILLCLKFMSFFSLGNSNSIASIDISNAYIGVDRYSVAIVGTLTFFANWAGSIWWVLAGNLIRCEINVYFKTLRSLDIYNGDSGSGSSGPVDDIGSDDFDSEIFAKDDPENDDLFFTPKEDSDSDDDYSAPLFVTSTPNSLSEFLANQVAKNINDEEVAEKRQIKSLVTFLNSTYYTTTFHSLVTFVLSIGVTILKDHLFIWTVFSPKYLYQIVWCTLFQLLTEIVGGGLICWICGNVFVDTGDEVFSPGF
ncbi:2409_t:CDS:10 [Acaulospora morrowiae]|uniref:GPI ethanolamine phosphate transferase 2 n=1 Tax=Acaulospora morrowiae TaxID=94023 RepID=A0A9N8ZE31_9GLOM|nr:2409_t:CDS:10 [Acaulospora morrowiae]